jgi:integrase
LPNGSLVLNSAGRPVLRRHRPYYTTKADADADKPRLAAQFERTGSGEFLFDRKAAEDYEAAKRLVGEIALLEVARFWRLHHPEKKTETLSQWAPRFLTAIQTRVGETRHPKDLKSRVGAFLRAGFGDRLPATVTRQDVLGFLLESIPPPKDRTSASPRTRANHKAAIYNFFSWLLEQSVITANPVDGITRRQLPKVVPQEVRALTLDEAARYLRACERYAPQIVAHEILQLISGVRADDEMADFRAEFVHPHTKEIVIPAAIAKTGVREVISQVEDSFWVWWEAYGPKEGLLRPPNYHRHWSRVRFLATISDPVKADEYAGLPLKKIFGLPELKAAVKAWPWNGRRRTFCTFHVAKYQSADRTALILRHRGSASTLHRSYRGLGVTQEEGRQFFDLLPTGRLNPVGVDAGKEGPIKTR